MRRERKSSRSPSIALFLVAALALPASAQEYLAPGVYLQEVTFRTGQRASGEAKVVESDLAAAPGSAGGAPGGMKVEKMVIEVAAGSLQRALERAHRESVPFDAVLRSRDSRAPYLTFKLEKVAVTSISYRSAGSARVVLGSAGTAVAPSASAIPAEADRGIAADARVARGVATGRRTYEPIVIRKRIDQSTPDIGPAPSDRVSARTYEAWERFWEVSRSRGEAAELERQLEALTAAARRGQDVRPLWERIERSHPELAGLSSALGRDLGVAARDTGPERVPGVVLFYACHMVSGGNPNCFVLLGS